MKKMPLLVQLMLSFSLVVLCLVTSLGMAYYQSSEKTIRQLIEDETRQSIQQSAKSIDRYMEQLKVTSSALSQNPIVLSFASDSKKQADADVTKLLETVLATNKDLLQAVLVTKDGRLLSTNPSLSMKTSSDMMAESWYQKAIDQKAMPVLTPARQLSNQKDKWVVSVTQEVVDSNGSNLGVLRLDLGYDTITSSLNGVKLGQKGFAFIVNNQHEFVYHPMSSVYSSKEEMAALTPYLAQKNGYVASKNRFVYQKLLPTSQWTIVGVASLERLHQLQSQTFWSLFGFGAAVTVICVLGIMLMLRLWIRPIRELQMVIEDIKQGNYQLRAREVGSKELVDLAQQFNAMLDENDRLMQAVAENEQAIGRYRLEALASQINPHFLYNTLDTIVWMASFNDSKRVVSLTKSLAQYFRLALNQGNEWISFANELEHVRHYLFIQKERYGDKLSYEIQPLASYQDLLIPKLILQPLVENAIYHGIKEVDRPGKIKVSVLENDEELILSVWDNGSGYKEQKQSQAQLERGGVGLANIDQRLQLQYGEAYQMTIDSQADAYTDICLHIRKNALVAAASEN
ncbi:two-component system sensor histidine kinase YesM [Streptococcus gallinaceus]|uniref:cache domain-containing sensor histidine kinase n=1 Tax=Streptococcus gallinaceus TaxID=165758 RepID=UPI0020A1726D|nr:sensor histidine kinase [Streptococcus gallinaceus]MCP1640122.1 two-component system sensor histidine kinase YesM [Streptococcus gallinaceus]MCP1770904.1 two-component system sensor histidine kinase YesM [Streptococcus gallinaceus]